MRDFHEEGARIKIGHVIEYDETRHMARVNFAYMGLKSYWLQVVNPNSKKNHDELHVDEGEHVVCLMQGTGPESGVILGAIYDDKNRPLIKKQHIRAVTFEDGTVVKYGRKKHKLEIEGKCEVIVSADIIRLRAGHIDVDGNVTCQGYCKC